MTDRFGRTISYLRVSVTDRCNLRCRYCMPAEGVPSLAHRDILSYEEIEEVARTAVSLGVTKVRITGGEPLVRRGIETLVGMLAAIDGVRDLCMTTNGTLLAEHASDLAGAGLDRINISLDTLDPDRYAHLTRGGDIRMALAGIAAAREAGLDPIKLNCVVARSSSEPDARAVAQYARENGCEARFIPKMNLRAGVFSVVEGGSGGDCPRCNRIRLSSDGHIRPCLFSDLRFSVRDLGAREAITRAVRHKPEAGESCALSSMRAIGG